MTSACISREGGASGRRESIRIGETVMSFLVSTRRRGRPLDDRDFSRPARQHRARAEAPRIRCRGVLRRAGRDPGPRCLRRGVGVPQGRGRRRHSRRAFRASVQGTGSHRRPRSCALAGAISVFVVRLTAGVGDTFEIRLTPKPAADPVNWGRRRQRRIFRWRGDGLEVVWRLVRRVSLTGGMMPRSPTDVEVLGARERLHLESIALATYRGTFLDSTGDRAVKFLRIHAKNYVDFEVEKTLRVMLAQADFLKGQLTLATRPICPRRRGSFASSRKVTSTACRTRRASSSVSA